MHVHSIFATVLASLADSNLPAIDQNTATFYDRYVIDDGYGGLAFEDEGARCAVRIMGERVHTRVGIRTIRQPAIEVLPDRIAVFGHVEP